MSVHRVQVIWSGLTIQGGGLSTFYFDGAVGTAAQQVAAVAAFLGATEDRRGVSVAWQTAADVSVLNSATGQLEGIFTTTPAQGVGATSGDLMPANCQGLLRLITPNVVGGRLLRGRIFLPGSLEVDNTLAVPNATYRTDYDTAGAALIADANSTWVVWSKTHGVMAVVGSVNTWTKWASLRSRRD